MDRIPPELKSAGEVEFLLPSRRSIGIPRARVELGGSTDDPVLQVLRMFQAAGWEGARLGQGPDEAGAPPLPEFPPELESMLQRLDAHTRAKRGRWPLCCWTNGFVLFVTVKRAGRERASAAEVLWLEAALSGGVLSDSFLIVEWTPA